MKTLFHVDFDIILQFKKCISNFTISKNICIFKKTRLKHIKLNIIAVSVLRHLKVKYLLKGNINLFCNNIF